MAADEISVPIKVRAVFMGSISVPIGTERRLWKEGVDVKVGDTVELEQTHFEKKFLFFKKKHIVKNKVILTEIRNSLITGTVTYGFIELEVTSEGKPI